MFCTKALFWPFSRRSLYLYLCSNFDRFWTFTLDQFFCHRKSLLRKLERVTSCLMIYVLFPGYRKISFVCCWDDVDSRSNSQIDLSAVNFCVSKLSQHFLWMLLTDKSLIIFNTISMPIRSNKIVSSGGDATSQSEIKKKLNFNLVKRKFSLEIWLFKTAI